MLGCQCSQEQTSFLYKGRVSLSARTTMANTYLKKWIHAVTFQNSSFGLFFIIITIFYVIEFDNCRELNSKGLYLSLKKEFFFIKSCLLFASCRKLEIRQFHVMVVLRRQRNVHKIVKHVPSCCFAKRELIKQRRQRRQRERQKSNRLRLAKQQLCTCITHFSTFFCRHCTTTTWKCLMSLFVEDVNTRKRFPFSFPKLW